MRQGTIRYALGYNRTMTRFFTALAVGGLFLAFTPLASAQTIPDPLSLVAAPSSPSPGESFTVQASTPTFDRNASGFTWIVDGRTQTAASGLGQNAITLRAKSVGSPTRIEVRITKVDGGTLGSALTIYPSRVSLTWFAETSVPAWYRGKTLPAQGGIITLTAIPEVMLDGRRIPADRLIYRWSLDDEDDALVGPGRQLFRMKMSDLPSNSHFVRLVVETADKRIRKESSLTLTPATPRVVLYHPSPLGSIDPRSIATLIVNPGRDLVDILAEPFFFAGTTKNALRYSWSVGGVDVEDSVKNPSLLTIDPKGQPAGTIPISLSVEGGGVIPPQAISGAIISLP